MTSNRIILLTFLSLVGLVVAKPRKADQCEYDIVESMPDMLTFNQTIDFKPVPSHEALIEMIDNAKSSIRVASFYWTLSSEPEFASHPSTLPGKNIMNSLEAAVKRGVSLQVVLDRSRRKQMSNAEDLAKLSKWGELRFLNMSKLLKSGVLHTKFLIADNQTFYVGSSNFDWRSYTQIKEIGIRFSNCQVLANDLDKIFQTYMYISSLGEVPESFPDYLHTSINVDHPVGLNADGFVAKIFLGGSPPAFNGPKQWTGRTDDIEGLLRILDGAHRRLDISVMNYSPRTEFIWPKKFWPRIDNALRRAASERGVQVRLLFSNWTQNKAEEIMWYRSLNAVQSETLNGGGIHVKMFKVPAFDKFQKSIPFARVKHDKYMVTERGLYIGTSNWSPDYFINTCGVGVVIEPEDVHYPDHQDGRKTVIENMQDLFERDFSSSYAQELPRL